MKLNELAAQRPSKQIAKVFESYFGNKIKFDKLTRGQTRQMLTRVTGLVNEHRSTPAFHVSERNQAYLSLVIMEQGLTQRLQDLEVARRTQQLRESEVQQAQVVLAAQDMVDSVQGMLEDVSEMQFKELPALVDSIRNQVGTAQADQFNTDANTALQTMIQSLQGAKTQLEQALAVVTGQAQGGGIPAMPGVDGELPPPGAGDELGGDLGGEMPPPEGDVDLDIDADIEEPAPGAGLGRKRR
jgi:hypothetical protein